MTAPNVPPPPPCKAQKRSGSLAADTRAAMVGDIEQIDSAIYRWACRDASTSDVRHTVLTAVLAAVHQVLTGDHAN